VFAAASGAVFVLLLFLYERFSVAISILIMPLLATCAVFIGLWLTGMELNITAMMGMTMIIGIVTEVAIFFSRAGWTYWPKPCANFRAALQSSSSGPRHRHCRSGDDAARNASRRANRRRLGFTNYAEVSDENSKS
jgi:hypothetical protein